MLLIIRTEIIKSSYYLWKKNSSCDFITNYFLWQLLSWHNVVTSFCGWSGAQAFDYKPDMSWIQFPLEERKYRSKARHKDPPLNTKCLENLWIMRNGSVLMWMEYLNTKFPDSLCLPWYVMKNNDVISTVHTSTVKLI